MVIYELWFLQLPFEGSSTTDLVHSILHDDPKGLPTIASDGMRAIVSGKPYLNLLYSTNIVAEIGFLCKNQDQRMNIQTMLSSPFGSLKTSHLVPSFRPMNIEERLKRAQIRQLSSQLKQIEISSQNPTCLQNILDLINLHPITSPYN